jgi:hypothetical protein
VSYGRVFVLRPALFIMTLQEMIEDTKRRGYDVEIRHHRLWDEQADGSFIIWPKGGTTVAYIGKKGIGRDAVIYATGQAECREDENYNRKLGAIIALGRARKKLETEVFNSQARKRREFPAELI